MKFKLLFIAIFFSIYCFSQNITSKIDAIINREMKERKIPGLQIAVVQNGKIVVSKSYGLANIQDEIPVKSNSVFPINSCTKVFTGVAVMQLVDQGKLNVNEPISKYLNDLPIEWQKITVDQLLTHISGLPDLLNLLDPATGSVGALRNEDAVWAKLKTIPLDSKIGEEFRYNQTNYYLIGKIIEKISGNTFSDFIIKNQLNVVGLKNTLYGDSRSIIPHYAPTYRFRKNIDGKQLKEEKLVNDYYEFPDFTYTSAGLNSTAEDIANWMTALQSNKLFKNSSTLPAMWSPSKFNNGTATNWVRGWGIAKLRKNHKAIGMSGGSRSAFLMYPDDDLAVVVLTNLAGSYPEDFIEEIAGCYNPNIIKADPLTYLRTNLKKIGFDKAVDFVKKEKQENSEFNPQESELNDWAYRMLNKNQLKEATEIFKLNVYLFPDSWNAYDSYGEILLKMNDKNKAIEMYRKSIDLNPSNENGKKILENMK